MADRSLQEEERDSDREAERTGGPRPPAATDSLSQLRMLARGQPRANILRKDRETSRESNRTAAANASVSTTSATTNTTRDDNDALPPPPAPAAVAVAAVPVKVRLTLVDAVREMAAVRLRATPAAVHEYTLHKPGVFVHFPKPWTAKRARGCLDEKVACGELLRAADGTYAVAPEEPPQQASRPATPADGGPTLRPKRKRTAKEIGPDFVTGSEKIVLKKVHDFGKLAGPTKCGTCKRTATHSTPKAPFLTCASCGWSTHARCADLSASLAARAMKTDWQCIGCKSCSVCGSNADPGSMLLCDGCDGAFHLRCNEPPLAEPPQGTWRCRPCARADEQQQRRHSGAGSQAHADNAQPRAGGAERTESVSPLDKAGGERSASPVADAAPEAAARSVAVLDRRIKRRRHQGRRLEAVVLRRAEKYRSESDVLERVKRAVAGTAGDGDNAADERGRRVSPANSGGGGGRRQQQQHELPNGQPAVVHVRPAKMHWHFGDKSAASVDDGELHLGVGAPAPVCHCEHGRPEQCYRALADADFVALCAGADTWSTFDVRRLLIARRFDREAEAFFDQGVDGRSLLLLRREDVVHLLGLKLGPAVKLYDRLVHAVQLAHATHYSGGNGDADAGGNNCDSS